MTSPAPQRNSGSSARVAIAVLAVPILITASCGKSEPKDEGPPNPGLAFSGTYAVEMVKTLQDGKPPTEAQAPMKFSWVVQSVCEESTGPCTAVAASTAPDDKTNLNRSRVDFIYESGIWTRVAEATRRDCPRIVDQTLIEEPWVGMHSTTFSQIGQPAAGPPETLAGTVKSMQGGSCYGVAEYSLNITRTGDIPSGFAPPSDVEDVEPVVANPPGAALSGAYSATFVRTNGPGLAPGTRSEPVAEQWKATPVCTRNGEKCAVAIPPQKEGDRIYVFLYADGHWERFFESNQRLKCDSSPTGSTANPRRTIRLENVDGANPATNIKGEAKYVYVGDCATEIIDEVAATRTGD